MIANHESLIFHRELADRYAKKLGKSEISSSLAFKSFVQTVLKLNIDHDNFEDEYRKLTKKDIKLDITRESFELLIILMIQDKEYSLKHIQRTVEFFSETLGLPYEDFSEYCVSSERLLQKFIPESLSASEYEKMFAFFYCMYVHSKTDRNFNTSEVLFLNEFADFMGIELENSNFWIGFREYEDLHIENLKRALSNAEKKCAYLGILALVMGGTKDFDPAERKLLQNYFNDLNLKKEDLNFLRSRPAFNVNELLSFIAPVDYPFLLTAIIEAVFADGKIDKAESELVSEIANHKSEFRILPGHLLKLYNEVITHAKTLRSVDAIYLDTICDLFLESVPDEKVRGQLFFLVETFYNLKTGIELSSEELETCLKLLKFSPGIIPEIVDNCRKNIKGMHSQIQVLAFVESIHCLRNSQFAKPDSLSLLLKKVLETTPLNKMKIMQLTLSFILSDKKLTLFDNNLIEDLSIELGLHREELKPLIFFMSLVGGEKVGGKIKFKDE